LGQRIRNRGKPSLTFQRLPSGASSGGKASRLVKSQDLTSSGCCRAARSVADDFRVSLNQLPAKKSAPSKLALVTVMKRTTSVSNRWLANRLEMGEATGLATILRRFQFRPEASSPLMKRVLSRFVT